jgi:DNA-directed RNA polymerase subunit M/transcription elongation factor TFIIS
MIFCKFCDNMMYIDVVKETNELMHYCKSCGNQQIKSKDDKTSTLVIDDNKLTDDVKYKQYINKYINFDNTLPHVNNIICPNEQCSKTKEQDNEVIYIKYDFTNMKYMYSCCYCKKVWRSV